MADQAGVAFGAVGPAGGQQEHGFEQVGLALRVLAQQQHGAGLEVQFKRGIVAVVGQGQGAKVHRRGV
jgi:hypothetical protein